MKNLGVIIEKKPKDFVGGTLPYEVLNESGDWTLYLPDPENQYTHYTDSMACVTFSILNTLETQYKFFTGKNINFSDRFIAKMSGTTHEGNTVQKVCDTIRKYGLVLEEEWPTDFEFDWDQYYAPIPQSVIKKAKKYDIAYEFFSPVEADLKREMKHAPLEIIIEALNPYHSVMRVNNTQQFDHYSPNLRPMKSINIATKILLKGINPMIGYKKVGEATTYVELSGKLVPVADWLAFTALGGSTESVVELSKEQFAKFQTINSVLFKSK